MRQSYELQLPQYREVFDLCADRAAVRFEDGRTGVVDDSGTPLMVTDRCRRLRFLKGELLSVTKEDGSDCVTRNFAASLFRNIKYFTLRKLYLCRKWMQKRLQKTTTTGITLPNFDFLA